MLRLRNLLPGALRLELTVHAQGQPELAQLPMYIYASKTLVGSICLTGGDISQSCYRFDLKHLAGDAPELTFFFKQAGLVLDGLRIDPVKSE